MADTATGLGCRSRLAPPASRRHIYGRSPAARPPVGFAAPLGVLAPTLCVLIS